MKKKFYIYTLLFILFSISTYSQVGINTSSPAATLDIWSQTTSNNVFRVVNENAENVQIINDGRIGLGVSNPSVNFDLRGLDGAVGIGYANISASDAGAGAIRYNSTLQMLEYSDGLQWVSLQASPVRLFIIANNSSGQVLPITDYVAHEPLVGWSILYDNTGTNSFDVSTGIFTAPRTGLYSMSVTAVFSPTDIVGKGTDIGQYELSFYGAGAGGQLLKSVVPFLAKDTNVELTNTCRAIFYLTMGAKVTVAAYIKGVDAPQVLSPDGSLNMLTIAEM